MHGAGRGARDTALAAFDCGGGLFVSAVLCVLNIAYNMEEILRHVEDANVSRVFEIQVITINPIAYLIGIGTLVALAWPVVKTVKQGNAVTQRLANLSADARRLRAMA